VSLGIGVSAFLCVAALGEAVIGPMIRRLASLADMGPVIIVQVGVRGAQQGAVFDPREVAKHVQEVMGREVGVGTFFALSAKVGRRPLGGINVRAISGGRLSSPLRIYFTEHLSITGRELSRSDDQAGAAVCVLSERTADTLFPEANPVGKTIRLSGWQFRIVGVTHTGQHGVYDFDAMTIPLSTALARFREQCGRSVSVAVMSDKTRIASDMKRIIASFKNRLPKDGHVDAHSPWLEQLDEMRDLNRVRLLIGLLSTLLLAAGLLGMVSMLLANVNARMREIGVHRALGATRWRQASQVLAEAGITGLLGGVAGIFFGLGLLALLAAGLRVELPVTPAWMVAAVFASASTALLAGAIPARAAMVDPVVALRQG
jgi:putative ABC transport system permease protein